MDRAILLLGDRDMLPEERLAWRQRYPIHLAVTLPMTIDPKTPFHPNAPMPTQPGQMLHPMGVCEPAIRGTDDVTRPRQQFGHFIQQPFVDLIRDTTAGMCQHSPHH